MENTELLPLGTEQGREEAEYSSFDLCLGESFVSPLVEQHRQWLKSIRHETPSPKIPFKVAVYIRFFNQTKYGDEEYLERNKEVFRATLAQYPLWKFVGFYIDNVIYPARKQVDFYDADVHQRVAGKSILPELRVIESGILKGFVTISPKWAGFKAADYLQASMSVYTDDTYYGQPAEGDATFEVAAGDFDLRGFEVTNSAFAER